VAIDSAWSKLETWYTRVNFSLAIQTSIQLSTYTKDIQDIIKQLHNIAVTNS